jgi:hypothetical protein
MAAQGLEPLARAISKILQRENRTLKFCSSTMAAPDDTWDDIQRINSSNPQVRGIKMNVPPGASDYFVSSISEGLIGDSALLLKFPRSRQDYSVLAVNPWHQWLDCHP